MQLLRVALCNGFKRKNIEEWFSVSKLVYWTTRSTFEMKPYRTELFINSYPNLKVEAQISMMRNVKIILQLPSKTKLSKLYNVWLLRTIRLLEHTVVFGLI